MVITDCYTERGDGKVNEDIYGYKGNMMWVIDGATSLFDIKLFDCDDDVAYYVRCLSKNIERSVKEEMTLSEIIIKSIKMTNQELGIEFENYNIYELPSFAIGMVRVIDDICEYYVLGDCTILVKGDNYDFEMTDKRLLPFTEMNRKGVKLLREKKALNSSGEIEVFRETRKLMNKPNGYWIGSLDAKGIEFGVSGKIEIDSDVWILAYTDGLSEAFDLFYIAEKDSSLFEPGRLMNIVKRLRENQEYDEERKIVRVRKKDDLTYIVGRS